MTQPSFIIYGTDDGYTAVTNEVRQRILGALAEHDALELPDLVELTDRSKSTLSSIHMRNLIDRGLVESEPHPTDGRRKLYRLVGRRIGSSDLPVDELRGAVHEYVTGTQGPSQAAACVGLEAIAAAPAGTQPEILASQARRLAEGIPNLEPNGGFSDPLMGLSASLDRNALARALQIDMEKGRMVLELDDGWADRVPLENAAEALAGLVSGILANAGAGSVSVAEVQAPDRVTLALGLN